MLRFQNGRGVRYEKTTAPDEVVLNASGITTFGRRHDNDVCIDSVKPALISRVHATITGQARSCQHGGGDGPSTHRENGPAGLTYYTLTSVGMNGVSVNGKRVKAPTVLLPGDEVVFGTDKTISELVYKFLLVPEAKAQTADTAPAESAANAEDGAAESAVATATDESVLAPALERSQSDSLLAGAVLVGNVSDTTAATTTPTTTTTATTATLTTGGIAGVVCQAAVSTHAESTAGLASVQGESSSGGGDTSQAACTTQTPVACTALTPVAGGEQGSLSPLYIARPPMKRPHEDDDDDVGRAGEASGGAPEAKIARATSAGETSVPAAAAGGAGADSAATSTVPAWLEDINEELLCCICRELMVRSTALPCSHTFCKPCLADWLKKQKTCPNCRAKASMAIAIHVKALDNAIDHLAVRVLPDDEQQERAERIQKLADDEKAATAPKNTRASPRKRTIAPVPVVVSDDSSDSDSSDDDDDDDEGDGGDSVDYDDDDDDILESEEYDGGGEHTVYSAELASSGRAQCRGCRQLIANTALRWRKQYTEAYYDHLLQPRITTTFYHFQCAHPARQDLFHLSRGHPLQAHAREWQLVVRYYTACGIAINF